MVATRHWHCAKLELASADQDASPIALRRPKAGGAADGAQKARARRRRPNPRRQTDVHGARPPPCSRASYAMIADEHGRRVSPPNARATAPFGGTGPDVAGPHKSQPRSAEMPIMECLPDPNTDVRRS